MAFNLYFAGESTKLSNELLLKLNCNRLYSQKNDRKSIQRWVDGRKECGSTGYLFIDSGAFSAHTKGVELNVDDYIDYLNTNDDEFHIFAQVDKIPGVFRQPKTKEQILEAPALSWENYLYMAPRVKSRDKLLPIFHQGENYSWLENMLEYKHSDGTHIKYIGISPANDLSVKDKERYIDKCFEIIKHSSNPNVCTHAFGMTSLKLLERYPFTSADSTSWLMTASMGGIMTPYGIILVSDRGLKEPKHIKNMPKDAQQTILNYLDSLGLTIEYVMTDYDGRAECNIKYLKNWSDNYIYKPIKTFKKSLF